MSGPIGEAEKVFNVLTTGRIVEKISSQSRLATNDGSVDKDLLKKLIFDALEGTYSVSNVSKDPKGQKAGVRCWLLNTLGRIADNDETFEYVRKCTQGSQEPNPWARYWAFESLIVRKVPKLIEIAETIKHDDPDPLVNRLATSILASESDTDALQEILDGVDREDWATLRALRVVPIEEAVDLLCKIVSSPNYSDATYDAIVALGALPPDWSSSGTAISALISCVKESRRHPWWDGMRTKAINALCQLKASEAVPVLVEELSDSNPAIVLEAAKALEQTVGVNRATSRIVEAASLTGEEATQQYANALRWMDRESVVEELESLMLSGTIDQQETARALLSEVGGRSAFEKLRARAATMKQHLDVLEKTEEGIRELFDSSLVEARSGYKIGTYMDISVFVLGIVLVVLSGYLVVLGKETLAGLTGAGGALAVLYNLFLSNPRNRVQNAVEHMMSLKVIFLGYLRQLHQADKAYVRRFLDDSPLLPEEVKEYSAMLSQTMRDAVLQIRQYSAKDKSKDE
jgi:HEAT repeat protein